MVHKVKCFGVKALGQKYLLDGMPIGTSHNKGYERVSVKYDISKKRNLLLILSSIHTKYSKIYVLQFLSKVKL